MYGKKKSALSSLFTFIITLLVIILAVGVVFKYTKAGDKIKEWLNPAFCVEYDGEKYDGNNNIIALPTSGQARFKVKGAESYKVILQPNVTPETDFTYEIGNTVYRYSQADLSKLFIGGDNVKAGDFYLNCLDNYSLESVLSKIHNGAEIKLNGTVKNPYLLTFSADGKTITFEISPLPFLRLSEYNHIF